MRARRLAESTDLQQLTQLRPSRTRHCFGLTEPHPLLKLRPPAPKLKGLCTPRHFRRLSRRLTPRQCEYLNEVCWLSAKEGYCFAFQPTLAERLGCSVRSVHNLQRWAEVLGYIVVVPTGRENLLFPQWGVLQLDGFADQAGKDCRSHSLNHELEGSRAAAERARPFEHATPTSRVDVAAAAAERAVITASPAEETMRAEPRARESHLREGPVRAPEVVQNARKGSDPHIASLSPSAPSEGRLEASAAVPEPDCELVSEAQALAVAPATAELVGAMPAEQAAVAVDPRLMLVVGRVHGTEALRAVERVVRARPHAKPELVRQAVVKLAATPREGIKRTPMAALTFWLGCAERGDLSLPRTDPAGGDAFSRLWHRRNAAENHGDWETARRLREAAFELGRREREQQAAREQLVPLVPPPVAAQLSDPTRLVLVDPSPKRPPPSAPPPLPARELLALHRPRSMALPAPEPSLQERIAALDRRLAGFLLPVDRMRLEDARDGLRRQLPSGPKNS